MLHLVASSSLWSQFNRSLDRSDVNPRVTVLVAPSGSGVGSLAPNRIRLQSIAEFPQRY
jgi:hypothetical protein